MFADGLYGLGLRSNNVDPLVVDIFGRLGNRVGHDDDPRKSMFLELAVLDDGVDRSNELLGNNQNLWRLKERPSSKALPTKQLILTRVLRVYLVFAEAFEELVMREFVYELQIHPGDKLE